MSTQAAGASAPNEAYCPTCDASFSSSEFSRCPTDGTTLVQLVEETDTLIGAEIDGRFTIKDLLGAGGMGRVYRAWQHSVGREVAIKVIGGKLARDGTNAKRFLREAKLTSRLSHPHTVTVLDFGQHKDGTLYLVMELIEGQSLLKVLQEQGALGWERTIEIGLQICDALEAAHKLEIIHRDLKPDNIVLVNRKDRDFIKILDFGLAKSLTGEEGLSTVTQTGMVVGTLRYVAPEIATGQAPPGIASDLYSVGVMLYEFISGHAPFAASEPGTMLAMHAHEPPPPLLDAPPVLENIIMKLLEKSPAARYGSAGQVREALTAARDVLQEQGPGPKATDMTVSRAIPESLRRPTSAERQARWGKIALGLLLVAIVGVAVLLVLSSPNKAPEPTPPVPATRPETKAVVTEPPRPPEPAVPAPPPSPEPPAGTTTTPQTITQVQLDFRSTPPSRVYVQGIDVGPTPVSYRIAQSNTPLHVVFRAAGREAVERSVLPDTSHVVDVVLPNKRGRQSTGREKPAAPDKPAAPPTGEAPPF